MSARHVGRSRLMTMWVMLMMIVSLMLTSVVAFADTKGQVSADEQAKNALTVYVQGQMQANEYSIDGGGHMSGSDLFEGKPTEGYDLDEEQFQLLTRKAQSQVVEDIATYSNEAIDDDEGNLKNVSESTVQNWWRDLQSKKGVGTQFLNEILKNTKPDFVTANLIYEPFSGVVGTVLGLIAVLLMAFLGIVMVSDIAYIALPPVRMLVADQADSKGGSKPEKSKIFSHDALYAVECAENNSDGGSGGGKQALGIYLKRRIVMLIILGICLMYLIQGQIYVFVGMILDLLRGFLGF